MKQDLVERVGQVQVGSSLPEPANPEYAYLTQNLDGSDRVDPQNFQFGSAKFSVWIRLTQVDLNLNGPNLMIEINSKF